MRTLNAAPRFLVYSVSRALRHPRTPISYYYCDNCKTNFRVSEEKCPGCYDKVSNSPVIKQESPIPWWGSIAVIMLGIVCWVLGACLDVAGLDEAGRVLVYIPLGSLFGMSLHRQK